MSKNSKPIVAVAIPAFNEEKTIAKVVLSAQKYVDKIIVCDDGSTDLTGAIARKLGADVITHETNMGYGAAMRSLFKRARELRLEFLVTLDADGQHNPDDIPSLLKVVFADVADIAIGSRFLKTAKNNDAPMYRRLGIKAITKLTKVVSNYIISDAQSGLRAYNRKALAALCLHENGMGASVEILIKANEKGLRLTEVPVGCSYENLETSTHSPMSHAANVVMSLIRLVVERKPLLFLGVPGVALIVLGALFGVWMIQIYTIEHRIVTNIALASISLTLMGIFATFTAITLYAIVRLAQKLNR